MTNTFFTNLLTVFSYCINSSMFNNAATNSLKYMRHDDNAE